jgi:3-oxoacyl-[acyl-carrier protein] reductase
LKGSFLIPGAEVFLSGRSKSSVEAVANEIAAKGGLAHTTVIDTSNDATVNEYLDGIVKQTGKIDILLDFAVPLAKEYGG